MFALPGMLTSCRTVCKAHKAYLKQNTNYSGSNQAPNIFHLNLPLLWGKLSSQFKDSVHEYAELYACLCMYLYMYLLYFFPLLSHETTCDADQIQAVRYQKIII